MADTTQNVTAGESEQVARANESGLQPVVFVHGLWLLPSSWDRWAEVFEEAGYTALTPGWPDDPDTVEEANANPEVFADKTVGQVADHFADVIGAARARSRPSSATPSAGCSRRSSPAAACRRRRWPSIRRRSAASCRCRSPRCKSASPVLTQPGQPPPRGPADLRAVPLRASPTPSARTRPSSSTTTYAVPASGAPLFQAATANLNPWTEAKVDTQEPRPRAAADRLRREGQHRAVGHRQRLLQEAEAQRRRDRDRRDRRTAATR